MKTAALAATVLLFSLLIAGALALPNIKVDRVQYSPISERVVARIANDSEETAENFVVAILVDGKLYKTSSEEQGFSLGPNSTLSFSADFKNDGKTHYFTAIADYYKQVEESNEEDNLLTVSLEGERSFTGTGTATGQPGNGTVFQPERWDLPIAGASAILALLIVGYALLRLGRKRNA